MRIKSYFAKSVNAAIREARQELGPDAMLIESRPSPAESRQLGEYEVVFGIVERSGGRTAATGGSNADDLATELKLLRSQIDELRRVLQPEAAGFSRTETDEIREELIAADFDGSVAASLVDDAAAANSGETLREAVQAGIHRRCGQGTPAAGRGTEKQVVVFAGPPGAGKTTSLAKMAVQRFLARHRSTRIISMDGDRAGSHERLRVFSAIAGIGFTAANSIPELIAAVEQSQTKHDILIDTPGFAAADLGAAKDLAQALDRISARETHLVLPASMRRRDLERCADRFKMFDAAWVLLTRLDETDSLGAALSTVLKVGKPLSYVSAGQGIPEDLETANVAKLTSGLFATAGQAANAA